MLRLLGNSFRSYMVGRESGRAVRILQKSYGVPIDNAAHFRVMHISQIYGDSMDGYDYALTYLREYIETLDPSGEKTKERVTKFVRLAAIDRKLGIIKSKGPIDDLFVTSLRLFGVDVNTLHVL